MYMEKIDPRVDIAFKKIFGVEENKDLLVSLINSIVSQEDQVREVTLLNPYNHRNFKNDKLSILDIKATGEDGKRFNIEIQITDDDDYDKRALYYWAKLYTEQLQKAQGYASLSKAIGIHILYFTSIPEVTAYHNVFHITEKETGFPYFKNLELHTIELKKFAGEKREELKDVIAKAKSALDIWSTFLTRHDLLNKDALPSTMDIPALKKALGVLEVMNFQEDELQAYEEHLKWLLMEDSALKKSEAKGFAKGKAEGKAEGREEGEKAKALAVANIAKNMLAKGIDLETVSSVTELSIEDIKKNILP